MLIYWRAIVTTRQILIGNSSPKNPVALRARQMQEMARQEQRGANFDVDVKVYLGQCGMPNDFYLCKPTIW